MDHTLSFKDLAAASSCESWCKWWIRQDCHFLIQYGSWSHSLWREHEKETPTEL